MVAKIYDDEGRYGMKHAIVIQYALLLFGHYVGDFILQTHWQAANKSKRLDALASHVGVYTATMGAFTLIIFSRADLDRIIPFIVVNGLLHFATDLVTSRINSGLFSEAIDMMWRARAHPEHPTFGHRIGTAWHNFFVAVGGDQQVHHWTLLITMLWFLA